MINPNRTHRTKGTITAIRDMLFGGLLFTIIHSESNSKFESLIISKNIQRNFKTYKVGDVISCQVRYSIVADDYIVIKLGKIHSRSTNILQLKGA
jgi:hypothetical protein